ncbi:hypothetical protein UFOVP242_234 [uncultured Caudovirales phage]|uniref:Uncharacterized protein n=1 Tax=uncultured Caudovirales phage TaxID=2100421 RepID=A0A6J7WW92_9CAUD|nr:hypothetical protein UFOVP242_234 [uncultured Caudovirales phage]
MKNLNMWYNEKLDEYAKAIASGIMSRPEIQPSYTAAHEVFNMAMKMVEIREQYTKND